MSIFPNWLNSVSGGSSIPVVVPELVAVAPIIKKTTITHEKLVTVMMDETSVTVNHVPAKAALINLESKVINLHRKK